MEKTYNARLSFKGEGSFTFTLPNKGEITIYAGRDIYIKGLSVKAIETLRQLRPLLLEHKLNAKPDGCYYVIDLESINTPKRPFVRAKVEESSIADLKASMTKTEEPVVSEPKVEEPKEETVENKQEEPTLEEKVETMNSLLDNLKSVISNEDKKEEKSKTTKVTKSKAKNTTKRKRR